MNEGFLGHDDTTWSIFIHELFLVLRLMLVGLTFLLTISFIAFLFFLFMEGPIKEDLSAQANQDLMSKSELRKSKTIRKEA